MKIALQNCGAYYEEAQSPTGYSDIYIFISVLIKVGFGLDTAWFEFIADYLFCFGMTVIASILAHGLPSH